MCFACILYIQVHVYCICKCGIYVSLRRLSVFAPEATNCLCFGLFVHSKCSRFLRFSYSSKCSAELNQDESSQTELGLC